MCFTEFAAHNLLRVAQNQTPKKACLMPKVHVMVATRGVSFKRGRCYQNECNWHFVYAQSCESREMSWKIQLLICMCECVRFMPECCCALQKRGMWHSNILTLITHNHVWCCSTYHTGQLFYVVSVEQFVIMHLSFD